MRRPTPGGSRPEGARPDVLEGSVELELKIDGRGERLTLLRERAVWWRRRRTLFVADVHVGKAAAFRAWGAPVPEEVTGHDLARLGELARGLEAERLIVLGDLLHAAAGMTAETNAALRSWRGMLGDAAVWLIRGNHDRKVGGGWAEGLDLREVDPGEVEGDFGGLALLHDPADFGGCGAALAGHLHPGVVLRPADGGKGAGLRAPCFWLRSSRNGWLLVLPAFGTFTGLLPVCAAAGDRVFAVGPGCVIEAAGDTPVRAPVVHRRRLARGAKSTR